MELGCCRGFVRLAPLLNVCEAGVDGVELFFEGVDLGVDVFGEAVE